MKKIVQKIAVVSLLVFSILVTPIVSATSTDIVTQDESSYYYYDAITHQESVITENLNSFSSSDNQYTELPGYYPSGMENNSDFGTGMSTYAVVDDDTRKQIKAASVAPYSTVVHIYVKWSNGNYSNCSGFMIGPNAVATAAHCIYKLDDESNHWPVSATITPGKSGTSKPFGTANAISYRVSGNYASNGDSGYDWGIIELDTNIGTRTGWMTILQFSSNYINSKVYNYGYPDKITYSDGSTTNVVYNNHQYMYYGTGYIRRCDNKRFFGDWDATGGNSGGPVCIQIEGKGPCVIGILSSGSNAQFQPYPQSYSTAIQIDSNLLQKFSSYR